MIIYGPFIFAYGFICIIFFLLALFSTPKKFITPLFPFLLLTLIFPSVGYGLYIFKKKQLEQDPLLNERNYYIFSKMGKVHIVYTVALILITLYIEYWWIDGLSTGLFGFLFSWNIFLLYLIIILIVIFSSFISIFIWLPFIIASAYEPNPSKYHRLLPKKIRDSPKWKRKKVADNPKDVSYKNTDEYIPLKDDDEDDFTIDLD